MERKGRTGNRAQYHVVRHEDRWWVENDDGISLHASPDQHEAVIRAIKAAQHDHAQGLDALVCVEQSDGSWKTAWHS